MDLRAKHLASACRAGGGACGAGKAAACGAAFEGALRPLLVDENRAEQWARSLQRVSQGKESSTERPDVQGEVITLLQSLVKVLLPILVANPPASSVSEMAIEPVDGVLPATSSDAEAEDPPMKKAMEFNLVDPDELDFDDEEDGLNEEQQRQQEILGETAVSENGSDAASAAGSGSLNAPGRAARKVTAETCGKLVASMGSWSLEMIIEQRCLALAACMEQAGDLVTILRTRAEGQLDEARRNRAGASAVTFKSARIIFATVVGAARQLKALRAAEPFAMIVEEACEVMEPVRIAVLSIPSLCKLELVGDHRQLPAFVQQCWFNLEKTIAMLKISLFERILSTAPCTVLDEQRRMRPAIADLTRWHYVDLVTIQDHVAPSRSASETGRPTRRSRLSERDL